jgi:hypothetical protein
VRHPRTATDRSIGPDRPPIPPVIVTAPPQARLMASGWSMPYSASLFPQGQIIRAPPISFN